MSEIANEAGFLSYEAMPWSEIRDTDGRALKQFAIRGGDYFVCLKCGACVPQHRGCVLLHEAFHANSDVQDLVKEMRSDREQKKGVSE